MEGFQEEVTVKVAKPLSPALDPGAPRPYFRCHFRAWSSL